MVRTTISSVGARSLTMRPNIRQTLSHRTTGHPLTTRGSFFPNVGSRSDTILGSRLSGVTTRIDGTASRLGKALPLASFSSGAKLGLGRFHVSRTLGRKPIPVGRANNPTAGLLRAAIARGDTAFEDRFYAEYRGAFVDSDQFGTELRFPDYATAIRHLEILDKLATLAGAAGLTQMEIRTRYRQAVACIGEAKRLFEDHNRKAEGAFDKLQAFWRMRRLLMNASACLDAVAGLSHTFKDRIALERIKIGELSQIVNEQLRQSGIPLFDTQAPERAEDIAVLAHRVSGDALDEGRRIAAALEEDFSPDRTRDTIVGAFAGVHSLFRLACSAISFIATPEHLDEDAQHTAHVAEAVIRLHEIEVTLAELKSISTGSLDYVSVEDYYATLGPMFHELRQFISRELWIRDDHGNLKYQTARHLYRQVLRKEVEFYHFLEDKSHMGTLPDEVLDSRAVAYMHLGNLIASTSLEESLGHFFEAYQIYVQLRKPYLTMDALAFIAMSKRDTDLRRYARSAYCNAQRLANQLPHDAKVEGMRELAARRRERMLVTPPSARLQALSKAFSKIMDPLPDSLDLSSPNWDTIEEILSAAIRVATTMLTE